MTELTKPADCNDMDELRRQIDKLDVKIIELLAHRSEFIDRATELKERVAREEEYRKRREEEERARVMKRIDERRLREAQTPSGDFVGRRPDGEDPTRCRPLCGASPPTRLAAARPASRWSPNARWTG